MRLALAGALLFGLVAAAGAQEPLVGHWVLDRAAFRAQVEQVYAEAILQVPAEQRETAEALAEQAVDATVAQMAGSSATFAADGTVLLEPAHGEPQPGTWHRDGDRIVLEPLSDVSEATRLVGTLDDGRVALGPPGEDNVVFILRRAEE